MESLRAFSGCCSWSLYLISLIFCAVCLVSFLSLLIIDILDQCVALLCAEKPCVSKLYLVSCLKKVYIDSILFCAESIFFFLVICLKSELPISGTRVYFFFELDEIGVTYLEVHVFILPCLWLVVVVTYLWFSTWIYIAPVEIGVAHLWYTCSYFFVVFALVEVGVAHLWYTCSIFMKSFN